ncbi:MAG: ATPase, T2SS/T4P/T4SS family [Candidatus Omnitrophica bacterium]|jgi:septum site-determining protein MinD|nr:Flp pilus assembly complex ATPase component TadA [Candidatus Omnitrophota bacterium]MDD5078582.1 ATPase, T2SS/T4P/T4SS family [Candidatus Omnitrophota bacterium]MDD5725129.1 ATPase, T2SS/T4P/T4SS family [Candidatus Omnitrophota bacterium]
MAKIIVIFSTKGGVGKTLISANLAASLAKEGKRVCVVDLDTQVVGDMAHILGVDPQACMADLINFLKKQPQLTKKHDFVVKSKFNNNVDFLAGVLKPQQSGYLYPEKIPEVFAFLDKDYDYIVVDAGKSFSDLFLATLNQANLILLIVTPDVLSVYQTKWALDTLQFLNFPLSMIQLVLNRAESLSSISWQEIRVHLPVDIIAKIPSEGRLVNQAVNQGVPVVIDSPRSKISASFFELTNSLISNQSFFVERRNIDEIKLKRENAEKPGQFWEGQGLGGSVLDPDANEDKDEILILKRRIHSRLLDSMNIKKIDLKVFSDHKKGDELKKKAAVVVSNLLLEEAGSFIPSQDVRKKLIKEILDEALGLGAIEDLLADPDVTDIMVNNKDEVYVERFGKIALTSKKFISNDQVRTIIERIIAPIGRRIDESVPMVDARLTDGSRVNAIISPLSLTGPTLTIRKFRKERYKTSDLINFGALTVSMADFIKACVLCRKNMIVSGGTGSGKTTVLNALSEYIPEGERIITLEDAAELKLNQRHWIRLESRPPNIEGKGGLTIRDLFRNTLRMRPDRIIVGECRGTESLDMLQAMNTGHDGSMTTIHANSTADVLSRLDSMILMSGIELPARAIREMVSSAVDIIVHTARLSDGSRKVLGIAEVAGMQDELHIRLNDIFVFKQTGVDPQGKVLGYFTATGYKPTFLDEIRVRGISISDDIFKPSLP